MKTLKIGLLNLSNALSYPITETIDFLQRHSIQVSISKHLYDPLASPKEKADVFNTWIKEDTFDYICDVSGGDLANTTLPYLDLAAYKNSRTIFMGYSDVTCVLDALLPYKETILYQICNHGKSKELLDFLFHKNEDLIKYSDRLVGGNVRCFLKLAGTPYFPDVHGCHLFLESYSGKQERIESYFAQLAEMGVFEQIDRLILGNFSEFLHYNNENTLLQIAKRYCPKPIEIDLSIGHQYDSFALLLGKRK